MQLVQRCQLLKRYTYWTALETLPIEEVEEKKEQGGGDGSGGRKSNKISDNNNSGGGSSQSALVLSKAAQLAERKVREEILNHWNIHDTGTSPLTECNKLLKDLQRARNKSESLQISFFQVPVNEQAITDYSVYVRNPADLSTIKYRLDGTLPGTANIANAIGEKTYDSCKIVCVMEKSVVRLS